MFFALPLRDHPNPSATPWITYALMGVNVAVYIVLTLPLSGQSADLRDPAVLVILKQMHHDIGGNFRHLASAASAYDIFLRQYGFQPLYPSFMSLFTCMFLHGGFWHLAGNMLFLHIFGNNVEHRLGGLRFLQIYILTGIVGTIGFALFQINSSIPLVGASGAISGVLGCYFVWFPRNQVRLLTVIFWFIQVITVPARYVLGFYIVIENILPFILASGIETQTGVAHGAHIGGFLAGMLVATKWFPANRRA